MDVEKLEVDGNEDFELKFILRETTPAYTNTLRRIMLLDVPSLAIQKVIIRENNTAMFDEYIAHRLAMIPIWSDIDYIETTDSCEFCGGESPDGCSHCSVELALLVETDENTERMVMSKEIISRDSEYYPIHEDLPIIKMGGNQRLELDAIARFGRGREHAKFSPVGTIGYQYYPSIKVNGKKKNLEGIVEVCPRNVFEIKGEKVQVIDEKLCNLCNLCVKKFPDRVAVNGDKTTHIFQAISTGVLYIEDIVLTAADILDRKADEFLATMQEALDQLE